jgi:Fe-S cluster biogenesis protein NfuA
MELSSLPVASPGTHSHIALVFAIDTRKQNRLERGLKEKIPEIQEVIQSMPQGPPLNQEQVDIVLDGVRPFLQVVGGSIDLDRLEGIDGLAPMIWLHMQGNSASLNSVKLEIAQRLQRHFMMSGLQIQWKE